LGKEHEIWEGDTMVAHRWAVQMNFQRRAEV
jgi:hypothetical protein